jgi:hypothetical protein
VIELYAITDNPAPPRPPLRAVQVDGLTALCAPAQKREVTPAALWRHEELIEDLMEERDLLPVRYGTLVADEPELARALAERRTELASRLDHVRGAVELAVRVNLPDAPESPPPTDDRQRTQSGSDYIRAKSRRTAAVRGIHDQLASLARDSRLRLGPGSVRGAYLVDREKVEPFVAATKRLQQSRPELDLLCTGPWPPYSFAEASSR